MFKRKKEKQIYSGMAKAIAAFTVAFFISLLSPVSLKSQFAQLNQEAESQYGLRQYDSAIVYYTALIDSFPTKKESYYNRGLCYYNTNRLARAQKDFDAALQIDSEFDDARFMKSITLQKEGAWPQSFIEFKKLHTSYAGYNELKKRILYHNISVSVSTKWYYMIAIMLLFIILIGVIAKSYAVKKGL